MLKLDQSSFATVRTLPSSATKPDSVIDHHVQLNHSPHAIQFQFQLILMKPNKPISSNVTIGLNRKFNNITQPIQQPHHRFPDGIKVYRFRSAKFQRLAWVKAAKDVR